jgi:hypothetical protein
VYEAPAESELDFINIYRAGSDSGEVPGASTTGALIEFEGLAEKRTWGTWAVTAEEEE